LRASSGPTNTPTTTWNGAIGCVSPSQPSPAGGCIVQDATTGISLRVAQAEADVTSTVIRLEAVRGGSESVRIEVLHLTRQPAGKVLQQVAGYYSGHDSLLAFEPLPADAFGQPMPLVAAADLEPILEPSASGGTPTVSAPSMSVPFALRPVR